MKIRMMTAALLSGLVLAAGAAQADNPRERPDFATLDLNGDGALTLEEMQSRGQACFAEMDANNDGVLSKEELSAAVTAHAADRVARMLSRFDDNGDGLLQQDEMPARAENRAARMFDRFDADGDGTISAEEFDAAEMRMGERHGQGRGHGPKDRG